MFSRMSLMSRHASSFHVSVHESNFTAVCIQCVYKILFKLKLEGNMTLHMCNTHTHTHTHTHYIYMC